MVLLKVKEVIFLLYKSYRSRYVNGSLSSTEAIKPTLILPSGVTETITNVSGYYFKVTITIPEHSKPASRTLTIRANQPNGLDRELVQTVQQSASTYEFYITDSDGKGHYTDFTFPAPSEGLLNKHVLNLISTYNGSPLSADDMEEVHSEITEKLIGLVLTQDTQSPFRFIANISKNEYTERTGADTYRQKASGKQ